jgi:hypothetical protein
MPDPDRSEEHSSMSEHESDTLHLSGVLLHEAGRLASHPLCEVGRLERDAAAGENAATPAILILGMALFAWALVALVVATVLIAAALLTR